MSERESWMPDTERLCMAFDLCDQAWDEIGDGEREPNDSWLDPLRAVVREAVEKALAEQMEDLEIKLCPEDVGIEEYVRHLERKLAEQEARHRREVLEAKLEAIYGIPFTEAGGFLKVREERLTGIMEELRAELAALDAGEEAKP